MIGNSPYIRIQAMMEYAPAQVEFYKALMLRLSGTGDTRAVSPGMNICWKCIDAA